MNARDGTVTEVSIVLLAAAIFVAAEIWLSGAAVVFTRPLWLDEIHTVLVAGRQDLLTSMRTLAAGADFNPPTLFLLFRAVAVLRGGLSEPMLRVIATASVVGTLPIVYLLLRRQFAQLPSAIGALAVWAQSVVVTEAFDARFYGPWLFGAASLSLAVRNTIDGRPSWTKRVFLAVASVFVCTIHYFGILSWLGAVLVAVWFCRGERKQTLVRLLPALAGPTALAMCLPFYLGQRAALSTATWIPDLTVLGALFLLGAALIAPPVAVALIGWAASQLLQRKSPSAAATTQGRRFELGPALLLGQAVVPIALAIFSLAVQPSMQPRYSIAAALVAAPIVALAFSSSTRLFRIVTLVSIVVSSATLVAGEGRTARARSRTFHQDVDQVSRIAALDSTVVVRRRHSLYPILLERPTLATHAFLFDGASARPNDKFEAVERDVARVHQQRYGFPRIVTSMDLESTPAFYFLELDSARSPTAREFPGRHIQHVGERMFRIEHNTQGLR